LKGSHDASLATLQRQSLEFVVTLTLPDDENAPKTSRDGASVTRQPTCGLTVTGRVPALSSEDAEIAAAPKPAAVTRPPDDTVATTGLDVCHRTRLVRSFSEPSE
jgi:hypothetical protein